MRPPSAASSGGHLSAPTDHHHHNSSNRQHCPPLPERFVAGLRCAFQLLDINGSGKVPFEQICKKWPVHFAEAPVPSNFLECLRRVNPSEEMVTFEQFIKGAQVALRERMNTAGRLKRVQSEGKLFGGDLENGKNGESNRAKSRSAPSSTPPPAAAAAAGPHPLRSNGHPSMGLSGRKLDGRGGAGGGGGGDAAAAAAADHRMHRLVRLKRASRSQPQLNELFDGAGQQQHQRKNGDGQHQQHHQQQQQNGRRTNCLQENQFNFHFADKNGSSASPDKDENDVKIVYRSKKYKAPLPPQQNKESGKFNDNRRPISVASTVTSTIMQSSPLSAVNGQNGIHMRQNSAIQTNGTTNNYADELQPQVAKHERLLDEEFNIVKMGTKKAQELMDWYADRAESLEKRKRMLNKGMVALDSAIHEQKLNFHRAQIAEMNRRITTFLASSERGGFPSHTNIVNNNNNNNNSSSATPQNAPQQIRSQVLPPPFPPQSCYSSVPNSSSNCSSSSSSSAASSALDSSNFCTASEAEFLRAQNQKLTRDIQMLAREVEQLRVERRRQPPPPVVAAVVPPYQHHPQQLAQQQNRKMNLLNAVGGGGIQQKARGPNDYLMMWHGVPVPNSNGFPPFHAPPKDTLL
ncbi:hypothetical protein niasHT_029788 [Heterodera trifolii]|uniref:EF-hand domain-containing protein n=1 Tax=Heterodera trifolii TaxID=157864 RepID=A0ABD2KHG8_9BILA